MQEGRDDVAKVLLRRALRGLSDEFLVPFFGKKVLPARQEGKVKMIANFLAVKTK